MRLFTFGVFVSVFELHSASFINAGDGFLASASAPVMLREAALAAKGILDEPLSKQRLEAMARTIRYSAPARHQRTLLLTAAHHIIGDRLEKYGVSQENMGIVFRELHHLSRTDPEIARWIQQTSSLVQSEKSNEALLSGAAALHLSRASAALALDKFIDIVTSPQNAGQLRAAVRESASAPDPPKHLLSVVRELVGDHLVDYGITKDNLLTTFAHLRSWSMEDSQLGPRMEKLMRAFDGGSSLPDERESALDGKHPRSVLDVGSETLRFPAASMHKNTPENEDGQKGGVKSVSVEDVTALSSHLLRAPEDVRSSLFKKHVNVSEIASQISSAAAHDPKMVAQIMSVIDLLS